MKRAFLNGSAAISILLLVATIGLWIRTCLWNENFQTANRLCDLSTEPHAIWFGTSSRPYFRGIPYQRRPPSKSFSEQYVFFRFETGSLPEGKAYSFLGFLYC